MSTFLQIAQAIRQEAGISGTGPTTVITQTGQLKKVVDWAIAAWINIQSNRSDWKFMRTSFSFATTDGVALYERDQVAVLALADEYIKHSFTIYLTSDGVATERSLPYMEYDLFRPAYEVGSVDNNFPAVITETPAGELKLGAAPDGIYTVRGEFYRTPQELSINADVPIMPTRYHRLITLRAMMMFAGHEEAGEIYRAIKGEYMDLYSDLERRELPQISAGAGALA